MAFQIPTVLVDDLRAFHDKHFPDAPTPEHYPPEPTHETLEQCHDDEDDCFGYHSDGTRCNLDAEGIAYYRHIEIRKILRTRRERREGGKTSQEGDMASDALGETAGPMTATLDAVQSGRVEKPAAQQWATSSARTKARNKRNRNKYRAKKKEQEKQKKERLQTKRNRVEEDDESDEWDPWHQANGPDAQKDEALDLDY